MSIRIPILDFFIPSLICKFFHYKQKSSDFKGIKKTGFFFFFLNYIDKIQINSRLRFAFQGPSQAQRKSLHLSSGSAKSVGCSLMEQEHSLGVRRPGFESSCYLQNVCPQFPYLCKGENNTVS